MTRVVCVLVLAVALQACGGASAPVVPAVLTLEIPELELDVEGGAPGAPTALAHSSDEHDDDDGDDRDDDDHHPRMRNRAANVRKAVDLLRPVSEPLKERLFWSRLLMDGLTRVSPRRTDEGWVWTETFRVEGFEASLVAREPVETHEPAEPGAPGREPASGPSEASEEKSAHVHYELRVTGLRGGLTRFSNALVLSGASEDAHAGAGSWMVHNLESGQLAASVNWNRGPDGTRELLVTGATDDDKREGRQLRALRDGDRVRLLFRRPGHKNDGKRDVTVSWNAVSGAGRVVSPGDGDLCWETTSNERVDIPCPPGDWP